MEIIMITGLMSNDEIRANIKKSIPLPHVRESLPYNEKSNLEKAKIDKDYGQSGPWCLSPPSHEEISR